MKIITSFLLSLILFLTSCGSALTPSALPSTPQLAETTVPANTLAATATNAPTPTAVTKGQSGKKSGGKNQPAPTSANPLFLAAPISGNPTDHSITLNFVPANDAMLWYQVSSTDGLVAAQTEPRQAQAGKPLETVINGLQPNTRYGYTLMINDQASYSGSFTTQRAEGSTFTFTLQGDSHPERVNNQFDPGLYTRTLQGAASDTPDFHFTIGDDFSVDALKSVTPETVRALYLNQRQWLGLVSAPVFLVNGNHEQAAAANLDGTANNVAVWAQTSRNSLFPQPAPDDFYTGDAVELENIGLLRDYYAFTWGDALFVVIDPYWHTPQAVDNVFGETDRSGGKGQRDLWNVTLGDEQYQWFKETLEGSASKYKFVLTHHVLGTGRGGIELAGLYEWGGLNPNGSDGFAQHRPTWDKPIQQLMADEDVTIFFQGHDHIFVTQELDGVIYQTLPEPANPNQTYENTEAYKSGTKFPNSGRLRVTVAPTGVTVEYVYSFLNQPDQIAASYTVK